MNKNEIPVNPSLNELIWNDSFRGWVLSPGEASDSIWSKWIIENPGKKGLVNSAKEIIMSMQLEQPDLSAEEISFGIKKVLNEINATEYKPVKKEGVRRFVPNIYWMGIAASLLLALIVSVIFLANKSGRKDNIASQLPAVSSGNMTVKTNTSGSAQIILMPDGSKIVLENNSRISYRALFNEHTKREINLSGDAYFEVAKNPSKPFLVYTNGLITKVLGTKFFIRSGDSNKKISVEVISGIVAVYSYIDKKPNEQEDSKKLNSLILTANQKANYSEVDKTLMATIVPNPVVISPKKIGFRFENTPVDSVFKDIEEAYGIDIIYDEKIFAKRTFTASLNSESLYDKMDIISKAMNAYYEVIDGKIVLYTNEAK